MHIYIAALIAWAACAAPALAQTDSTGVVDTRPSVLQQIARLEHLTSGDVGPDKMKVYLSWLADLYMELGEMDAAQTSYQRILVLDPYDLATSNLLAGFLLDRRDRPEDALDLLNQTIGWASQQEPESVFLGQTYALKARALNALGRYEEALTAGDDAAARLDPATAEDALRTRAASLEALGRSDEAAKAFEHLIGITVGSNRDDINALIAIETARRGSIDADQLHARVKTAIETARRERAEDLAHEGAEMVELEGEGRVRLEGTLRRSKGADAVLFVPDLGGRRSDYTPYAQLLALEHGMTTLAIDPRGHGDSRCDSLPSGRELSRAQRDLIASDIALARRYLTETVKISGDRIAIVVAGEASTDVERAMHDLGLDAIVVHLSPVFDPADRDVASAIEFRPPRPALVMVSEEDVYSMQSAYAMRSARSGPEVEVKTVRSSGHGAALLRRPENFAAMTRWLSARFQASR